MDKTDILGPWGGSEGKFWAYLPQSFIRKIVIARGSYVYGIKFYTVETESSDFGVMEDDAQFDEICLKYPDEYLTSISGTVGTIEGVDVVMSLSFVTNQYKYGPYGNENDGTPFSYTGEGVMIIGFHGRTAVTGYLGAVGICVMPLASAQNYMHQGQQVIPSRIGMPRDAGPWGPDSIGHPWDDGVFSTVKKVFVCINESYNVISSIRFVYVRSDATSYKSQLHGGIADDKTEEVSLYDSDEYFTGISGFYGHDEGDEVIEAIKSITFYTNMRILGPYGAKSGAKYASFSSAASPGKILGFHGRNDCFLRAIGVHMKYL